MSVPVDRVRRFRANRVSVAVFEKETAILAEILLVPRNVVLSGSATDQVETFHRGRHEAQGQTVVWVYRYWRILMTATLMLQYFVWISAALLLWSIIGSGRTASSGASRLMAFTLLLALIMPMIYRIGGGWSPLTGLVDQTGTGSSPGSGASDATIPISFGSVVGLVTSIISISLFVYFVRNNPHGLILYLAVSAGIGLMIHAFWLEPASNRILQVYEAEEAARGAQAAVMERFEEIGRPPLNRIEAGLDPDPGYDGSIHIRSVDIIQGSVIVTFSEQAATPLAGKSLVMTPYERDAKRDYLEQNPDGVWSDLRPRFSFFWGCDAETPPNHALLGTAAGFPAIKLNTTLAEEYLPATC